MALCTAIRPPPALSRAAPAPEVVREHPYARPMPWLGAWYTLREGDPVAMRNRAMLKQRKGNSRGRFICQELGRRAVAKSVEQDPWRQGLFDRGDILEVQYRPSTSEPPERVVGLCIAKHKRHWASSFRLLCKPDNLPVEYQFQLHSPLLVGIEVRSKPKKRPRQLKMYYMRDQMAKVKLPKPTNPGKAASR